MRQPDQFPANNKVLPRRRHLAPGSVVKLDEPPLAPTRVRRAAAPLTKIEQDDDKQQAEQDGDGEDEEKEEGSGADDAAAHDEGDQADHADAGHDDKEEDEEHADASGAEEEGDGSNESDEREIEAKITDPKVKKQLLKEDKEFENMEKTALDYIDTA